MSIFHIRYSIINNITLSYINSQTVMYLEQIKS